MAWQLVYTSAPELLEAGRSGFGTVAKHEAIRSLLQTELERISQFNREQGLSKERIIFAHRAMDLRGERYHVLSRISDAGADYTGRTNHIAHHIVLTALEAANAGARRCSPADMIRWVTVNGLWRNRWNEQSRLFHHDEEIPTDSVTASLSLPAVTWATLTGTAANAAILAPGGSATEGCWLLYRDDQASQLLGLIGESLCLHNDPWSISFSTDTQPTDRMEELRWRGVSAGSPVELTARQSVRPTLDLGNPSSLQEYIVKDFRNQAETGLKKKPIPASSHEVRFESVAQVTRQSTSTTTNPFTTKIKGEYGIENKVSLKEKMGARDGRTIGKPKHTALFQSIRLIVLMFLIICLFGLWQSYILNLQKNRDIIKSTKHIIYSLTNEGYNECLISNILLGNGVPIGNDFRIVSADYKRQIYEADNQLSQLANLSGSNLTTNIKDARQAHYQGVLGSIIDLIVKAKEDSDNHKEEINNYQSKALSKVEKSNPIPLAIKKDQIITVSLDGKSVTNGQSITATNGQKINIISRSEAGTTTEITKVSGSAIISGQTLTINGNGPIDIRLLAPGNASVNPEETNIMINIIPPASRITKIEFFDKSKTAWDYFFSDASTIGPLPGWSYYQTNGFSTNLIALLAVPFTAVKPQAFEPNYPQSKKDSINNNSTNLGSCFFRKDNATQEITLTITTDKNKPITNTLVSNLIILQKAGEQFSCTLSTNIISYVSMLSGLTNSGDYSLEYRISVKPEVKGYSPESLAADINKKIRDMEITVASAESNLAQGQERQKQAKDTNSQNNKCEPSLAQQYPDMENAGEVLSARMTFKSQEQGKPDGFPDELKTFSNWLLNKKKERNKDTYTEYLQAVLCKIKDCENGLTFATDTYISSTKKIDDINRNNKPETATQDKKYNNDMAFISSFNKLFTADWNKRLDQFLGVPKVKPAATPDCNMLQKTLNTYRDNLKNYKASIYSSQQQIFFRDKKEEVDILIITSSP